MGGACQGEEWEEPGRVRNGRSLSGWTQVTAALVPEPDLL